MWFYSSVFKGLSLSQYPAIQNQCNLFRIYLKSLMRSNFITQLRRVNSLKLMNNLFETAWPQLTDTSESEPADKVGNTVLYFQYIVSGILKCKLLAVQVINTVLRYTTYENTEKCYLFLLKKLGEDSPPS